jgi:transposase
VAAERLERVIEEFLPAWSLAPIVRALQTLRGVDLIVAVTFATKVGDVRRFESPRQLMGYLGLVPSERSSGDTVRRGGITRQWSRSSHACREDLPASAQGRQDEAVPAGTSATEPDGIFGKDSLITDVLQASPPPVRR